MPVDEFFDILCAELRSEGLNAASVDMVVAMVSSGGYDAAGSALVGLVDAGRTDWAAGICSRLSEGASQQGQQNFSLLAPLLGYIVGLGNADPVAEICR
jgi:hypothetical protein